MPCPQVDSTRPWFELLDSIHYLLPEDDAAAKFNAESWPLVIGDKTERAVSQLAGTNHVDG